MFISVIRDQVFSFYQALKQILEMNDGIMAACKGFCHSFNPPSLQNLVMPSTKDVVVTM